MDPLLRWALAHPDEARLRLSKPRAENSLMEFVRLTWPVLEPARPLVTGWAVNAVAAHLEAITAGKIRRLLINVPPGAMKSMLCNVFWPAWEWGPKNKPSHRFFTAAYAEHLTIRDNRKCLQLIESPLYQQLWGDRVHVDPNERAKVKFGLLETGWKLASSVTGTGTGERADRVILDDLLNAREVSSDAALDEVLQYLTEVIPTRVNEFSSAIVLIMQRLHERDPAGHILANNLPYERLIIPMEYELGHPYPSKTSLNFQDPRTQPGELMWPERFSREHVEQDKEVLQSWGGEYAIASQFQQRPSPRGGGIFKRDALLFVQSTEVPPGDDVRGWDLAGSKDGRAAYTVGVKVRRSTRDGRAHYYILDVVRGRWSPAEVRQQIRAAAARDGRACVQDLPQDPGQAGLAQKHDLAQLLDGYTFSITTESGSKEDRARPLAAQVETGNVSVVRAAWTDQFVAELATFPAGAFKDQVDALSRAYARLLRQTKSSVGGAPRLVTIDPVD